MTTARLGFSRWSLDDLPIALSLWGDPRVTRLIGGPFSAEDIRQKLEREIAALTAHRVQYWPVFLLESGEHVGCAGLRPYRPEYEVYELGFHLRPSWWGRGMAGEAAQAIIVFAFGTLGAKGLHAGHHPANTASQAVLQRLGFRFTGYEFYPPTGLYHASYLLEPAARVSEQ